MRRLLCPFQSSLVPKLNDQLHIRHPFGTEQTPIGDDIEYPFSKLEIEPLNDVVLGRSKTPMGRKHIYPDHDKGNQAAE